MSSRQYFEIFREKDTVYIDCSGSRRGHNFGSFIQPGHDESFSDKFRVGVDIVSLHHYNDFPALDFFKNGHKGNLAVFKNTECFS